MTDVKYPDMLLEFPSFDQSTLPEIPEDWIDASWGNDACPKFEMPWDPETIVFIDFADPNDRELPNSTRFCACSYEFADPFIDTDDWSEIMAWEAKARGVVA